MDIVYTHGGGVFIEWVFNAVASIIGQDSYRTIITMGGLIGLFWILLRNTIKVNWGDSSKTMMIAISAYYFMFIPKMDVAIHDVTEYGQVRQVDNVPWVLGRLVSMTSAIGHNMTQPFDQFFSLPESQQYQKYGLLFGSDLLSQSNKAVIRDPMLQENVKEFINECVMSGMQMGQYSIVDIRYNSNLFKLFDSTMVNTLDVMDWQVPRSPNGYEYQKLNCGTAWQKIKEGLISNQPKIITWISNNIKSMKFITGSLSSNKDVDIDATINAQISQQANFFMNISDSSRDLLFHTVLRNAITDATATDAQNYSRASSSLQSNNMMHIGGEMAKQVIPLWRIFFEVLLYAGYILLIPLILILGAEQILLSYCKKLLELQLWMPLYAILNGLMVYSQKLRLKNFVNEGASISNIGLINDKLAQLSLIAGFGVIMIPFVAKMLMKGFDSLTHMAGMMMSPVIQTAHSTAAEVTSGNINLGNTSIGNHSWSNVNANKSDIAQIDTGADGIRTFTNQDGTQTYDGTLLENKFADFNLSYGKNISSSLSNQQESYLTKGEDLRNSSTESMNTSWSKLSEASQHYQNSVQNGESWTKDVSQEMQDVYKTASSINATYGAQAKGGINFLGNGGGVYASFEGQNRADAEELLQKTDRLSQSESFTTSNEQLNSLNESSSSHYSESIEQQKSSSQYLDNANRIANLKQQITSSDIAHQQSLNNEFVDYLRDDRGLFSNQIKEITANSHGEQEQEFIKDFIEYKTDKLVDPLNIDVVENNMKQDFANDTQSFDQNNKIEDKFTQNEKLITKENADIKKGADANVAIEVKSGFKDISDNPNIDNMEKLEINKKDLDWKNN
ncbi:conjugal transfer protein TraG N-terminal domain-containing protein [Rickettsiales bacterium]|nr:conjugal transfer protein TraG N-terminal domain-containing protein [Rickettsiales bacterium]